MFTNKATEVWNTLKGIICVHKPADISCNNVRKTIMCKISSELNKMDCRIPIDYVTIEGDPSKTLTITRKSNLADDPLVVGPRYQPKDILCTWSSYLGTHTSGVLLLGLQKGTKTAFQIRSNKLTRAYQIKGLLGRATDNHYKSGKVIEKSTFKFIKMHHLERLLASMQAAHQRMMFESCGVNMQSQAAYELAVKGLLRPIRSKVPVIYGIKCVQFEPPEFTIEVQCINEYEMYLKTLIHEIAMKLHSTAHCTAIQCIRQNYFNLDHALLRKHWTLQNIIENMEECNTIIKDHKDLIRQQSVALQ